MSRIENGVTRFNRYIVECKARDRDKIGNNETRFNRYIVECKADTRRTITVTTGLDLIDTLWNVKMSVT